MKILIFLLVLAPFCASAQWQFWYTPLADMPIATANNAVVGAEVNGDKFVYSFCGIDTTLTNEGIHLRSFKYDVANDQWALIPNVPDTLGKIAAAASEVGGILYVIGGYHVFDGSPFELSSNKVHRFDTQTDSWLSDGADIPIAIDDQVQAVWRDSLIYVVTGWSNTGNVPAVQIYDPANDTWIVGTATPNNNDYRAFGASGVIIGDTIFYYGGASTAFNFPAQSELRKGLIDPNDPSQITWSEDDNTPGPIYRPGAFVFQDRPVWLGGSAVSYNFDADAYNNSGIVMPLAETRAYDNTGLWTSAALNADIMDLRGVASFSGSGVHYIAGGIGQNAQVLGQTGKISESAVGVAGYQSNSENILVYPNPSLNMVNIDLADGDKYSEYQLFDAFGSLLEEGLVTSSKLRLNTSNYPSGAYFLKLLGTGHVSECRFWSVK